jgi:hypothetical protein
MTVAPIIITSAAQFRELMGYDPSPELMRVPPVSVIMVGYAQPAPAEIAHDLRPLSTAECATRCIRHSSTDDHSTGFNSHDSERLRIGSLRSAARRVLG